MIPWEYSPSPAGTNDINIQPISLCKRRTLGGIHLLLFHPSEQRCLYLSHSPPAPTWCEGGKQAHEGRGYRTHCRGPRSTKIDPILTSVYHLHHTCSHNRGCGAGVQASSVSTSSLRLSLLIMGKGSATSSQPILQKKGCSRGAYSPHMGHIYLRDRNPWLFSIIRES